MCPHAGQRWSTFTHTPTLLGWEQDPRGSSASLSATQMRLHISKMWEHHNEFQMGADEAKKLRNAADGCRHGAEASHGADVGSGKAPQGIGILRRSASLPWASGKFENHSYLDLRTKETQQVVAFMCEQPRGTLPTMEHGVLGLWMSSSRMLIYKLAIRSAQESLGWNG